MALFTFAVVYVFGGITFVPLLLAAILLPAWYLLPQTSTSTNAAKRDDIEPEKDTKSIPPSSDGAASGTFAVLRSYNFPAATAALNARNNNNGPGSGIADGEAETSGGSESVYQSMYRSVFDRGKTAATTGSVLEKDDERLGTTARAKKSSVPVNVFHIVLRHGHLMLYDSVAQLEVRHVISMASHRVSLSEGPKPDDDIEEMKDGDLFIKRTAIVLTPIEYPNGQLQSQSAASKPFFLFSNTCSENEDFYHALLYTRASPPVPIPLDPNDAIKLQSTLHSTSLTAETRALNALIGRIFLGLHRTDRLRDILQKKIEKKISRVQKPAFIASLAVHSVDLGDAAPALSNLKLKDMNIAGDMTVAFDIRYDGGMKSPDGLQKRSGGIKLTIGALAKLDLGARFKTRTVDLLLATSLQRLSGRMLVRIKPPPSNRIWFCFESMPEMDIKVEPVVSSRQITYTFVLRAIEERIRSVVGETLVKPNWDDVPFFDTRGQRVRGGIWKDEGASDPTTEQSALSEKSPRTMSMPSLVGESESSGASSGSETAAKIASGSSLPAKDLTSDLKRRSVASLPLRSQTTALDVESVAPSSSPSLKSPSFAKIASSTASVAVDGANVEQTRSRDHGNQSPRLWGSKAPASLKKEAMEAMREMRDRSQNYHRREVKTPGTLADGSGDDTDANDQAVGHSDEPSTGTPPRRSSDPASPVSRSSTILTTGTLRTPSRANSKLSTDSGSSTGSSTQQQQRKTILAATAAATTAARNWSWNAIANARAAKGAGSSHVRQGSSEPMGRGQPLPPPGTPLPGPQKGGMFGSLGGSSVKRKPLPSQQGGSAEVDAIGENHMRDGQDSVEESGTTRVTQQTMAEEPTATVAESEFGPWRENSGVWTGEDMKTEMEHASIHSDSHAAMNLTTEPDLMDFSEGNGTGEKTKKVPPPLPARPHNYVVPAIDASASSEDVIASQASLEDNPALVSQSLYTDQGSIKQAAVDNTHPFTGQAEDFVHTDVGVKHHDSVLQHDRASHIRQASTSNSLHSIENSDDAVVAIPAPIDDDEEDSVPEQTTSVFQ